MIALSMCYPATLFGHWTKDDEREHQARLKRLREMTHDEIFALAVRAGICTPDGELTPPYRSDDEQQDESNPN